MNPSWQVMKLTEWRGSRPLHWYRSELPQMRSASAGVMPGSPRQKRRTSSRYWPFHSLHRRPNGNLPTWYSPPASHGSAISFVSASTPSSVMLSITGGSTITFPLPVAAEDGGEVEPEAVDVHVADPVPQARS